MQEELWRPIDGCDNTYEVSSFGRVRNHKTGRIMKPFSNGRGYNCVSFRDGGKKVSAKIHRLVAIAFVSNEHEKPQVNHIDHNKENNRAENLEWATGSENSRAARDAGRLGHLKLIQKAGAEAGLDKARAASSLMRRKFSDDDIKKIRAMYESGDNTQCGIARIYGVNQRTIHQIVHRVSYRNV